MFHQLDFAPRYRCEWQPEIPGITFRPHLFNAGPGESGLFVKIWPEGKEPWFGLFGEGGLGGISGAFACPSESALCVVAEGNAYYIPDVILPTAFELVPCVPVRDVRGIAEASLIVFANYTELVAYGRTGCLWSTAQLVSDELRITQVDRDVVKGAGWDAPTNRTVEFVVDLQTGKHTGGSS